VGFHDYEACAAVCPVDCCVPDPNNVETEEVLIARARALHPETPFVENFESRFRKGQGKGTAAPKATVTPAAAAGTAVGELAAIAQAPAAAPSEYVEADVNYIQLPEIDSWNIPMRCFKCDQVHIEPVRNFMIGNVIFCPHCHKSVVVRDNLNFHIRTLLKDAYERWGKEQKEFAERRNHELAQFQEKRAREAQAFETHQQSELQKIRAQLDATGETYDAPGRPFKKGSRFGWG